MEKWTLETWKAQSGHSHWVETGNGEFDTHELVPQDLFSLDHLPSGSSSTDPSVIIRHLADVAGRSDGPYAAPMARAQEEFDKIKSSDWREKHRLLINEQGKLKTREVAMWRVTFSGGKVVISKLIDQDMRFVICKRPRYHPSVASGWGNGYVGVPADHPWFGEPHDVIDAYIHGGLTYSGDECPAIRAEDFKLVLPDYLYWFGFDTGHYSDNLERWPKEAVYKEAEYLYLQAAWAWAGIENPMHS